MVAETEILNLNLFESSRSISVTQKELIARILDSATRRNLEFNSGGKKPRYGRARFAKCTEPDGGNFRTFVVNCTRSVTSVKHICYVNITLKIKLTVSNFIFCINIHSASVFVDSNSSASVTSHI
jgi:hypothetical protein